MQIFLRTLTGKTITLDVTQGDTIQLVKKKLADKEALEAGYQILIYGGKELLDEKTISEYGIEPEATINVVQKLKGGNL